MSKASQDSSTTDPHCLNITFHDLTITSNEPIIDFYSGTVTESNNTSLGSSSKVDDVKNVEVVVCEEYYDDELQTDKSSYSSVSYCTVVDGNEASFRRVCPSKPHKGNDVRWEAVQCVQARDGELGLGHFRLLKKLGFGDIGSVYLAELRSRGSLFAMKVMDKGMLASRKKVVRAQTERDILGLLDHPFLPTLYSHFETDKFSCLLMEFCSGGDLHLLRQRQPGKHFSEQAARFEL